MSVKEFVNLIQNHADLHISLNSHQISLIYFKLLKNMNVLIKTFHKPFRREFVDPIKHARSCCKWYFVTLTVFYLMALNPLINKFHIYIKLEFVWQRHFTRCLQV
jgi:hypothetical protein